MEENQDHLVFDHGQLDYLPQSAWKCGRIRSIRFLQRMLFFMPMLCFAAFCDQHINQHNTTTTKEAM